LPDAELLAVLLGTGYAGCGVLELAGSLLERYPDGALGRLSAPELSRLKGIGTSRAASLEAALELGRRWAPTPGGPAAPLMESPESVWRELGFLKGKKKEHFVALYLDACNRLLEKETVSVGTLTASLVHPREVFSPAVACSAAAVIVGHNHPSGDPRPSKDDKVATRRLSEAGRLLGIPLLDHVVVADCRFFSFRERGLLNV